MEKYTMIKIKDYEDFKANSVRICNKGDNVKNTPEQKYIITRANANAPLPYEYYDVEKDSTFCLIDLFGGGFLAKMATIHKDGDGDDSGTPAISDWLLGLADFKPLSELGEKNIHTREYKNVTFSGFLSNNRVVALGFHKYHNDGSFKSVMGGFTGTSISINGNFIALEENGTSLRINDTIYDYEDGTFVNRVLVFYNRLSAEEAMAIVRNSEGKLSQMTVDLKPSTGVQMAVNGVLPTTAIIRQETVKDESYGELINILLQNHDLFFESNDPVKMTIPQGTVLTFN